MPETRVSGRNSGAVTNNFREQSPMSGTADRRHHRGGCGPLPSGRFAQGVEDPAEPGFSRLDPGLDGNALGLAGKAGDLDRHAEYAGGPD